MYLIDEQIEEAFSKALLHRDSNALEDVISQARDRVQGVCFCSAHSANECCCGAWDSPLNKEKS
jgi:hypothetical protein